MLKKQIRQTAMAQRAALSEVELDSINKDLLKHFSALNFDSINAIHIFLPIVEKREPNTFLFIDWLKKHKPHIKIIVPKADFDNLSMKHYEYLDEESLKTNLYNIPEPYNCTPYTGNVDMIIIPLLAFDSAGNRVGYGKGFYDRFLKNTKAKKIGLSLTNLSVEISDVQSNDVKLEACIAPTGLINFSK